MSLQKHNIDEPEELHTQNKKAKYIYDKLPNDLQTHFKEEFIIPELKGDDLIKEYNRLLDSEDCQGLKYQVLIDVVRKIINHSGALSQISMLDYGFKSCYEQHFIEKRNTFVLFDCPISSMCAEIVMRKYH